MKSFQKPTENVTSRNLNVFKTIQSVDPASAGISKKKRKSRRMDKKGGGRQRLEKKLKSNKILEFKYVAREILSHPDVPEEHRSNVLGQIIAKGERISIDAAIEFIEQKNLELILTDEISDKLKSEIKVYRQGDDNMSDNTVEKGMDVKVHYKGTLPENGEIFDSSEGRDPLQFSVGKGQMIPGFEEELMGANVGDKRTFTLSPERAYGQRDAEAILQIPRAQFEQLEEQTSLEVGFQLVAQMPHGPAPFTVTELSDDIVTADFNHALAGKELTFEVEVIEVSETPSGCGDPNCSSDSC